MSNERKEYWSDEEFRYAVVNSKSVSEVLRYFNVAEQQPHYRKRFYFDIKRLGLKITYGTPQEGKENDGKAIVANTRIKKKLIKNGIFKQECSICTIIEWQGQPLSLHLDHIDGNRKNNDISNYRLLCPNCHSQTPTHRAKNIKYKKLLAEKNIGM